MLLADGATGTNYQDMGIEPGVAPEEWVFDEPDKVRGAAPPLRRGGLGPRPDVHVRRDVAAARRRGARTAAAVELNRRAAELAREAVGDDVLVAGSLGPTGHLTEPLGPLTRELAVATFAEQARALADGGVDLLVLETFFSLDEGLWAVEGGPERERPAARRLLQLRPGDARR